ncbi:porin [Paucibacter sp. AS339]|uniref:porin n=1 Tax=Paucibacter hankyongi TaxID=3133434 RepID=UPI0030B5DE3B
MKKTALALGLLALASSTAWAQSSVTLYGIVDVGVRYTTNSGTTAGTKGSSLSQVIPGGMSNSRLGVNVTEDMGGGLKAIANLEHRLNSDTGAQTAGEFWRQSWVGLESKDYGRLTLGRQYNVLFDVYTSTYSSFKYSPYIEIFRPETVMAMGGRQSNMVKYLVEAGGFRAEAQVSAGEGATPDKSMGAMARYVMNEFALGAGFLEAKDTAGRKVQGMTVGGAYTSGPMYLNLSWAQNKFDLGTNVLQAAYTNNYTVSPNSALNAAGLDVKQRDMVTMGLTYQLSPQLNLGLQGWYAEQTHHVLGGKSKAGFAAAVADYALSKRTDVYAELDYTKLGGAVSFSNTAKDRVGVSSGIRHRF